MQCGTNIEVRNLELDSKLIGSSIIDFSNKDKNLVTFIEHVSFYYHTSKLPVQF